MTTVNWEEAGRGWGARAVEWAYLFEPYARPANELLFDRLGIGDGARLLDIACGSGFAAHLAAERKAQVSGLGRSGVPGDDRTDENPERGLPRRGHVRPAVRR